MSRRGLCRWAERDWAVVDHGRLLEIQLRVLYTSQDAQDSIGDVGAEFQTFFFFWRLLRRMSR